MKKIVHAACPHDCPDACGVLITVEEGRATRVQGDPAHPMTRGFLCAKVAKYLDRVYSPSRVLYPMRRVKPKGQGQNDVTDFTRISWDEALDEIAERLKDTLEEYGPETAAFYISGQLLTEDYYVVNKLSKGFLGINNVDSNSRLCAPRNSLVRPQIGQPGCE